MNEMVRDSISELDLEGQKRGMSYGQYVAARFYPVTVVEELPDGGKIVRSAALPPVVPGWEEEFDRRRRRSVDGPVKTNRPRKGKPARLCVVCGGELGPNQRRYCSDDCRVQKMMAEGRSEKGYMLVTRVDKTCIVCGKPMQGVLGLQKYCSPKCRNQNKYRAMRGWREANPTEREPRYCQVCGIRIEDGGHKYCRNCRGEG